MWAPAHYHPYRNFQLKNILKEIGSKARHDAERRQHAATREPNAARPFWMGDSFVFGEGSLSASGVTRIHSMPVNDTVEHIPFVSQGKFYGESPTEQVSASASHVQIDHIKSTPNNCARAISQGLIGRASKNSCVANILNAICDGIGTAAAIRKADAEKDNDGGLLGPERAILALCDVKNDAALRIGNSAAHFPLPSRKRKPKRNDFSLLKSLPMEDEAADGIAGFESWRVLAARSSTSAVVLRKAKSSDGEAEHSAPFKRYFFAEVEDGAKRSRAEAVRYAPARHVVKKRSMESALHSAAAAAAAAAKKRKTVVAATDHLKFPKSTSDVVKKRLNARARAGKLSQGNIKIELYNFSKDSQVETSRFIDFVLLMEKKYDEEKGLLGSPQSDVGVDGGGGGAGGDVLCEKRGELRTKWTIENQDSFNELFSTPVFPFKYRRGSERVVGEVNLQQAHLQFLDAGVLRIVLQISLSCKVNGNMVQMWATGDRPATKKQDTAAAPRKTLKKRVAQVQKKRAARKSAPSPRRSSQSQSPPPPSLTLQSPSPPRTRSQARTPASSTQNSKSVGAEISDDIEENDARGRNVARSSCSAESKTLIVDFNPFFV